MVVLEVGSVPLALSRELEIAVRLELLVEWQGRVGAVGQEGGVPAHLLPLQETGRGVGGPPRDVCSR